jgi:magnesium chelatase family protein
LSRYLARLSGPLLDRIDIQVEVSPVPFEEWAAIGRKAAEEPSSCILERVKKAREIQRERLASAGISVNAHIPPQELKGYCNLDEAGLKILGKAAAKMGLSARSLDRVLRVARTIADLDGSCDVSDCYLGEALQYRSLERLQP